jgi:hypothetical protein
MYITDALEYFSNIKLVEIIGFSCKAIGLKRNGINNFYMRLVIVNLMWWLENIYRILIWELEIGLNLVMMVGYVKYIIYKRGDKYLR